jgi:hypothetical protein
MPGVALTVDQNRPWIGPGMGGVFPGGGNGGAWLTDGDTTFVDVTDAFTHQIVLGDGSAWGTIGTPQVWNAFYFAKPTLPANARSHLSCR